MKERLSHRGRAFFFGLFLVLAVLVLFILSPYLSAIAIALVTVVMLSPLYSWYLRRGFAKDRPRVATTLTLISFFLLIIIPLFFIGYLIVTQAGNILEAIATGEVELSLEIIVESLEEFLNDIPPLSEIELSGEQIAETLINAATAIAAWLANLALQLGASLPQLFIGGIIFLIVVATLLPRLDELEERAEELSPLDVNITKIYLLKGREMIASVMKGVFLLAIIQGLIMGVFYWLAGVPFAPFWTLLSMAFAVLPVVGISFIVLPMAAIALLSGNTTSAVLLLIGFYVFVNPTDLTLRPRLVSKEAYLNFTLMLLALFGGLAVGGLLGMIYGPVIMILFITTIDIYGRYFAVPAGDEDVTREDSDAAEALTEGPAAAVEETALVED